MCCVSVILFNDKILEEKRDNELVHHVFYLNLVHFVKMEYHQLLIHSFQGILALLNIRMVSLAYYSNESTLS